MANLKEIRNRIVSVNSTMQITSAMKMVSAAKLKRAQDAITQMRPYAEKLQEILANVSSSLDATEGKYSTQREAKKVLIVVVSSNRGLCGAFNNNVIKRARAIMAEESGAKCEILGLGKKAFETFRKEDLLTSNSRFPELPYTIFDELNFENVSAITSEIMDAFVAEEFDKVYVVYNKFKNAATQIVMTEQLLPMVNENASEEETTSNVDYIFEPSKKQIVEELIPKSIKIQLYKGVLDSFASEHGARMTAMHKATDNAKDLKHNLSLSYNKARQAAITNEILEIVAGAEAL